MSENVELLVIRKGTRKVLIELLIINVNSAQGHRATGARVQWWWTMERTWKRADIHKSKLKLELQSIETG